jgi:hypothetical protein
MEAARAALLPPEKLDFSIGGGPMLYAQPRLELPHDLAAMCADPHAVLFGGAASAVASARRSAGVIAALVLLARGKLDGAHDLVGELDTPEATYCHAMIHRREGEHRGEAGLTGFANAEYWFECLGDHPLQAQVLEFAVGHHDAPSALSAHTQWGARWFVQLCATARRATSSAASTRTHTRHQQAQLDAAHEAVMVATGCRSAEALTHFCEAVQQHEWKLLLDYCVEEHCLRYPLGEK